MTVEPKRSSTYWDFEMNAFRKTPWWYRDTIPFLGRTNSPAELMGTYGWPILIGVGLLFLL